MKTKTLIVLSLFTLLSYSCKKDDKTAVVSAGNNNTSTPSTPTPTPTKSILGDWYYSTTNNVRFDLYTGTLDGTSFTTVWSTALGTGSASNCLCQTNLVGTAYAGSLTNSYCQDFTSGSQTPQCISVTDAFDGGGTYEVTLQNLLVIRNENGTMYINSFH